MSDKAAGPNAIRPPLAPYDKTSANDGRAGSAAAHRQMDRQRIERERRDRYGRFGGR